MLARPERPGSATRTEFTLMKSPDWYRSAMSRQTAERLFVASIDARVGAGWSDRTGDFA
jgi:hypothetical protein